MNLFAPLMWSSPWAAVMPAELPGKRYEDWEIADPAGQSLPAVRAIRDDIERRVRMLLDPLVPAGVSN